MNFPLKTFFFTSSKIFAFYQPFVYWYENPINDETWSTYITFTTPILNTIQSKYERNTKGMAEEHLHFNAIFWKEREKDWSYQFLLHNNILPNEYKFIWCHIQILIKELPTKTKNVFLNKLFTVKENINYYFYGYIRYQKRFRL